MHLLHNIFFLFFAIATLTLVGTFIDARWRQNPQSRPLVSGVWNHTLAESHWSIFWSSDGVGIYGTQLIPHRRRQRICSHTAESKLLKARGFDATIHPNTDPLKSMMPPIDTQKTPPVTVQPVWKVCVPHKMCQSQQPGPNLHTQTHAHTHRAALGGLKTDTSCREKEEEALVKEERSVCRWEDLWIHCTRKEKKKSATVLSGRGVCVCVCMCAHACLRLCVSWSDVLCNACGVDSTFPKGRAFVQWGGGVYCGSHVSPHTKLYSLRLSCRMVSLTAANTNRMFSVSVAQVKWE